MTKLKLFFSSKIDDTGCNLSLVKSFLSKLRNFGIPVELIDTVDMDDKELINVYKSEGVPPSVKRHYRIGHIFGTRHTPGAFFGKEQPALLVYHDLSEKPTDIFPHTSKGQRFTIVDFLREMTMKYQVR